jgi:hypothetical protein
MRIAHEKTPRLQLREHAPELHPTEARVREPIHHTRPVCIRLQAPHAPQPGVAERAVVDVHRFCVARIKPTPNARACFMSETMGRLVGGFCGCGGKKPYTSSNTIKARRRCDPGSPRTQAA